MIVFAVMTLGADDTEVVESMHTTRASAELYISREHAERPHLSVCHFGIAEYEVLSLT